MIAQAHASTRIEWRDNWPVLVAALIGFSTLGLQSYGIGAFVPHLEREFGWTRAQVMIGISVSNGVGDRPPPSGPV